jgi:hypothetical protein
MSKLADALGQSEAAARQVLWNTYHPQSFWYICTGVGVVATLGMVGYHFWLEADARRRRAT